MRATLTRFHQHPPSEHEGSARSLLREALAMLITVPEGAVPCEWTIHRDTLLTQTLPMLEGDSNVPPDALIRAARANVDLLQALLLGHSRAQAHTQQHYAVAHQLLERTLELLTASATTTLITQDWMDTRDALTTDLHRFFGQDAPSQQEDAHVQ